MNAMSRWGVLCGLALLSVFGGAAHAAPESGWWWNPAENGRGFFLEIADTQVYMAGYFYESDGRATWLVSQGQITSPTSYHGRLLAFAGGQKLFGLYQPPGPAVDVGAVSVQFTDDRHAVLTWPGGTIAIERQVFGAGAASFQPHTGWWWDDTESGRGYSVEIQGDQLFLVGFMYDTTGQPLWYFAAGKMATPTHFEGQLLQFGGGQTLAGPYRPPGTPNAVGSATLDFTRADEATLTISDTAGALPSTHGSEKAGKPPSKSKLKPQLPPPKIKLPNAWSGPFAQAIYFLNVTEKSTVEYTLILTGVATFTLDPDITLGGHAYYSLSGVIDLDFKNVIRSDDGVGIVDCKGETKTVLDLNKGNGNLTVGTSGNFTLRIEKEFPYFPHGQCTFTTPSGSISMPFPLGDYTAELSIKDTGQVVSGRVQGNPPPIIVPSLSLVRVWNFSPQ